MTTATMAYDYFKDTWVLFSITICENTTPGANYVKRMLNEKGNYLFPEIIDVPIKSFSLKNDRYSIEFMEETEFPDVLTLEESLKKGIEILSRY